jgi:hypothetical protein
LRRAVAAVHLLALAAAIGAPLCFAFAVAPASFAVLPVRGLAGDLNGRVLQTICVALEVAFALLFGTVAYLSRGRGSRLVAVVRRLPVLAFFAAMVTGQLVIPAMDRIRAALPVGGGPMPASFGRLHALASTFLSVALACALGVLAWTAARLDSGRDRSAPIIPGSGAPERLE